MFVLPSVFGVTFFISTLSSELFSIEICALPYPEKVMNAANNKPLLMKNDFCFMIIIVKASLSGSLHIRLLIEKHELDFYLLLSE